MNHTPGPWDISRCDQSGLKTYAIHNEHFSIARISGSHEIGLTLEANAKLIAAAPEMLEALKKISSQYTLEGIWQSGIANAAIDCNAIARAVLEKLGIKYEPNY